MKLKEIPTIPSLKPPSLILQSLKISLATNPERVERNLGCLSFLIPIKTVKAGLPVNLILTHVQKQVHTVNYSAVTRGNKFFTDALSTHCSLQRVKEDWSGGSV